MRNRVDDAKRDEQNPRHLKDELAANCYELLQVDHQRAAIDPRFRRIATPIAAAVTAINTAAANSRSSVLI